MKGEGDRVERRKIIQTPATKLILLAVNKQDRFNISKALIPIAVFYKDFQTFLHVTTNSTKIYMHAISSVQT